MGTTRVRDAFAVAALTAGGTIGAAWAAPETKLQKHDTIGAGELVILKLSSRAGSAEAFADDLWLRRLTDGDEVPVTVAPGRPLLGEAPYHIETVAVPFVIEEQLVRDGLSAERAERRARTLLRRLERTGSRSARRRLERPDGPNRFEGAAVGLLGSPDRYEAFPEIIPANLPDLGDEQRAFRLRLAGDDDAWLRFRGGDASALDALTGPDAGLRFREDADGGSMLEHLATRRVLVRRSPRHVMVLPALPQEASFPVGLQPDNLYELRRRSQPGFPVTAAESMRGARIPVQRDAIRLRVDSRDYPYLRPSSDFLRRGLVAPRLLAVLPPPGETEVPVDRPWINPLELGIDKELERHPRVDVWFSHPVDPASLAWNVRLTLVRTGIGTDDERELNAGIPVPIWLSLQQSHLGDVHVIVRARHPSIDPGSRYVLTVGAVRGLRGWTGSGSTPDRFYAFETERVRGPDTFVVAELDRSGIASPRAAYFVDTALWDVEAGTVTTPREPGAYEWTSDWYDLGRMAPAPFVVTDENAPEGVPATRVLAGAPGTTVSIECRTAPENVTELGIPDIALATTWVPFDEIGILANRRMVQFRARFTVPEGLPPDADLPVLDRIVGGVRGDD